MMTPRASSVLSCLSLVFAHLLLLAHSRTLDVDDKPAAPVASEKKSAMLVDDRGRTYLSRIEYTDLRLTIRHKSSHKKSKNNSQNVGPLVAQNADRDQLPLDAMKFIRPQDKLDKSLNSSTRAGNASLYLKSEDGHDWDCHVKYQQVKQHAKGRDKGKYVIMPLFCVCERSLACLQKFVYLKPEMLNLYRKQNKRYMKINRGADFQCEIATQNDFGEAFSCSLERGSIPNQDETRPATNAQAFIGAEKANSSEIYCNCINKACLQKRQRIITC